MVETGINPLIQLKIYLGWNFEVGSFLGDAWGSCFSKGKPLTIKFY